MEVRTVPPMQGWLWVLHGFTLLRAHPALWLLNLLFYWLCLVVVSNLPWVGAMLASMLIPGFSAGFMIACRATQLGRAPQPAHLIAPFRSNPKPQVVLGVAYVAALVLLLGASALLDGGVLFRLMLVGGRATEDTMRNSGLQWSGLLAMALYAPVLLAFWFAPALCLWQGMTPGKALFFSFFAGLRNTRAFLVYGLGWALFAGIVPMLLGLGLGIMLPQRQESVGLVALVITPYMLAMVCAMMCSFYSSYAGIFGEPAEVAPDGGGAP
jgi:hypothetical protein